MKPIMRSARVAPVLFFLLGASSVRAEAPPPPEPMAIVRATGEISVDGDLSDAGWQGALSFDRFYETSPGDNIPAKVKTTLRPCTLVLFRPVSCQSACCGWVGIVSRSKLYFTSCGVIVCPSLHLTPFLTVIA